MGDASSKLRKWQTELVRKNWPCLSHLKYNFFRSPLEGTADAPAIMRALRLYLPCLFILQRRETSKRNCCDVSWSDRDSCGRSGRAGVAAATVFGVYFCISRVTSLTREQAHLHFKQDTYGWFTMMRCDAPELVLLQVRPESRGTTYVGTAASRTLSMSELTLGSVVS